MFRVGAVWRDSRRPLYERYAEWARRYGDVFALHVVGHTIVVLNSLELLREAFLVRGFFKFRSCTPVHDSDTKHLYESIYDLIIILYLENFCTSLQMHSDETNGRPDILPGNPKRFGNPDYSNRL